MKVFKNNVLSNSYFCVDIETTGLEPNKETEGILEIYIKIMKNGLKIKEYFLQYYHIGWIRTRHIHSIPYGEIEGKPSFIESKEDIALIRELFKRCADPNDPLTFMAQYAPFEYKWFKEFLSITEDEEKEWYSKVKTFDTRLVAKELFPEESHSLIPMCEKWEISFPKGQHDFHRADQDVNAMWELYRIYKDIIPKEFLKDYNYENYKFNFDEEH